MSRTIPALLIASLFATATSFAGPLTAKHSGKVIDIPRWNPMPGLQLVQWTRNNGPNQNFEVNPEGNGFYTIFSPLTRQCLDVERASRDSGAKIVQWFCHKQDNQLWRVEQQAEGYVRFVSKLSGKCLAVDGGNDGAALVQQDCAAVDHQRFRFY